MDATEKFLIFGCLPGFLIFAFWALFVDSPNERQRMLASAAAQGCVFVESAKGSPRLFYAECDGKIELRRVK